MRFPLAFLLTAAVAACTLSGCKGEPEAAPPKRPPTSSGYLEHVGPEEIYGWAWDPKRPDAAVRVDIYDGQVLVATVTASLPRDDLRKSNAGNGSHGFRLPTPKTLRDGRVHKVWARHAGTANDLERSPTDFQHPAPR